MTDIIPSKMADIIPSKIADIIPSKMEKKIVSFKITKKSISPIIAKKTMPSKFTTKQKYLLSTKEANEQNYTLFKNVIERRYNLSSKVAIKQQPICIICYKKSQKKIICCSKKECNTKWWHIACLRHNNILFNRKNKTWNCPYCI